MLNVALTGNVAAGKSSVINHFRDWGATIIDADAIVREVQAPGSPVLRAIAERFGGQVIESDGSLDRARLRRLVMGDDTALGALNAIVHPAVQQRRSELVTAAEANGDCIVVNDIPLLFEVLDPKAFDAVLLVDAPAPVRRRRLVENRAIPADEADRLIASQLDPSTKRQRSDYVIENTGSTDALERASQGVWRVIRQRAARAMSGSGGRLLAVMAHPDDESIALGGTLARYADAGVAVHLVTATAGEAGGGKTGIAPGALARVRRRELADAAETLGIDDVRILGMPDAGLRADDRQGVAVVTAAMRDIQPDVVLTFGPDGVTGHRDHRAMHAWTTQARLAANDRSSLYYVTYPADVVDRLGTAIVGRAPDEITARLDVRAWQDVKRAAIRAHRSQSPPFDTEDPTFQPLFAHEWYAGASPAQGRQADLFTPQNALDSRSGER